MDKNEGFSKMLIVRFSPGSACQVFSCCPLPAYWLSAIITVPSGNGSDFDNIIFKKLLVESTADNLIRF